MGEKTVGLKTIILHILCQFAVEAFKNDTNLTLRRQGGGGGSKALNSFLEYLLPEEGWQCVKGPTWSFFCNDCVCLGGQLYICTWRNCGDQMKKRNIKRQGKKANDSKQVANKNTKLRLSTFGMDTNCVEGEDIQSFDTCNTCYCGAGKILCTNKKCNDLTPPHCTPGAVLPTPDNCNSCSCNTHGRYICTTASCGPALAKDIKRNCKPGVWYSTRGDPHCRECFCLNGIMVLCYVSMCDTGVQQKADAVFLESADDLPETCIVGDYVHDKCTKCRCTEAKLWSCTSSCNDLALSSKKKTKGTALKGLIKGRKKLKAGQKLNGGNGYGKYPGGSGDNSGGPNSGGYSKIGGYNTGGSGYSKGGDGLKQNNNGEKDPKWYGQFVEEYDYEAKPQFNKPQIDNHNFPDHGSNVPNNGDFGPNHNGNGGFPNYDGDVEPNHNGNGGFPNGGHQPNNDYSNGGDYGPNHNGNGGFPNDGHQPNNDYSNGGDYGPNHNGNGGFPNDGHQSNNDYSNGGDYGPNHNGNGGFPNDGHQPNNDYSNGGDFGPNHNGNGGSPNGGHQPNNDYSNGGDYGPNHNGNGGFPNGGHQPNNDYSNGGDYGPNQNGNGGFPNDGHQPNNDYSNGGDFGPNHNGNGGFPNGGHQPNNDYSNGGDFGPNHNGNGGFPNDGHQPNNDYSNGGNSGPNHNGNGGFPNDGPINNPNGGDFGHNPSGGGGPNGGHGPDKRPAPHNGRGPYCLTGQYFTQGTSNSCQGCYCSAKNQWKCYSMRGPCRGYVATKKCSHGKLKKSPSRPCSVCYCGTDGTHFCATDEYCAYSIKPSHCEAAACHSLCAESNANMGICHQDKCVCVH